MIYINTHMVIWNCHCLTASSCSFLDFKHSYYDKRSTSLTRALLYIRKDCDFVDHTVLVTKNRSLSLHPNNNSVASFESARQKSAILACLCRLRHCFLQPESTESDWKAAKDRTKVLSQPASSPSLSSSHPKWCPNLSPPNITLQKGHSN